jgi:hypothetical protein
MASYSKKSRSKDPSYKRNKSDAPDTQLVYPLARISPAGAANTVLVEASNLLSGFNHRLYRQCGNYRMKIDIRGGGDLGVVNVYTLANTWFVKRAIQYARDAHDKAMDEERAVAQQARWYDFRIQPHNTVLGPWERMFPNMAASPGDPLLPVAPSGEYLYSVVRDANGNDKTFSILGGTSTQQYNIFDEYDNSANTMADPNIDLTTGAYDELDATLESANIVRLNDFGNIPPYNGTTHHDSRFIEHRQLFRTGAGNQVTSTGFFDAPLGMVWITVGSGNNPALQVEFAKGSYKGVRMEAY